MGRLQLEEMINLGDFDQALTWHLQYNHYPAIDLVFLPVVREAIEDANCGYYDNIHLLPNGKELSVSQIITELHLDPFIWRE